jgi:hypothetical protein
MRRQAAQQIGSEAVSASSTKKHKDVVLDDTGRITDEDLDEDGSRTAGSMNLAHKCVSGWRGGGDVPGAGKAPVRVESGRKKLAKGLGKERKEAGATCAPVQIKLG